jgi:hypothetical protein
MDQMTLLTCLVAASVGLLIAGIPWAMKIERTLSRIDTELKGDSDIRGKVDDMDTRILKLEFAAENQASSASTA